MTPPLLIELTQAQFARVVIDAPYWQGVRQRAARLREQVVLKAPGGALLFQTKVKAT